MLRPSRPQTPAPAPEQTEKKTKEPKANLL